MVNELAQQLKIVLASTFSLYLKTHNFHWNVEGPYFSDYHKFFGDMYNELWDSIDLTAEKIRMLDQYTPGSLTRFSELSVVEDQTKIPSAQAMIRELLADNQKVIVELNKAFHIADKADQQAIADYLTARLDAHAKHAWFLRSLSK